MRLTGKTAIITGAGGGQGRAAAELFAREGAGVAVADVDERGGRETVARIEATGRGALFVKTDVSRGEDVRALVDATVARFGGVDILYNNAGVLLYGKGDGPVTTLDENAWTRTLEINLNGVFLCSRYAIPRMIERGGGSVISTASIVGQVGGLGHAYAASKGAVIALGKSIAKAYGPQGVRSNVICPGFLDTQMNPYLADPVAREHMARLQLIPHIGSAEDVANLALFLASDESRWMTGAVVTLDGGVSMPLINPVPPATTR